MSNDFFADIIDTAPVQREINYRGKTKPVWFRRLEAGERLTLLQGMRYQAANSADSKKRGAGSTTFEMDLGDQEARKHKMVAFCVVNERGERVFKNPSEVQKMPDDLISLLYAEAQAVNDSGDAGNA